VIEYLRMDEPGCYTLHAITEVVAHDHSQATDGDLNEITANLLQKLNSLGNETYEQNARISYHKAGFGSGHVAYWRAKNTAIG